MVWNKVSGLVNLPAPALPVALAPGETFVLPVGQGVTGTFGQTPANGLPQLGANDPLTGQYLVQLGLYSTLQVFDFALNYWRDLEAAPGTVVPVSADGVNFRLANTSGCPIGAIITAAGSGGTNGFYGFVTGAVGLPVAGGTVALPGAAVTIQNGVVTAGNSVFTITPSAGGSTWNAIVGGAINTTISFSGTVYQNQVFGGTGTSQTASAGSNYTKAPLIVFSPPPNQGSQPYILPTAVCTISGGAINSITVTNQGAGLLGLPGITVVPQMGDTTGGGAVLGWLAGNASQVGSGTLLAMWPASYGTALTAVPTFTFGGTSNPAPTVTAIMNFTVTGFTQTTPGVGYVTAGAAWQGGVVAGSAANTNPLYDKTLTVPVFPPVNVAATTGLPSLAGPFGGYGIQAVPTIQSFSAGAAPGTAAVTTVNVGGANDVCTLFSL